ncbi:MAG: hypothetical protein RSB74_07435, partial [Kiritimatiellia bacterium]
MREIVTAVNVRMQLLQVRPTRHKEASAISEDFYRKRVRSLWYRYRLCRPHRQHLVENALLLRRRQRN